LTTQVSTNGSIDSIKLCFGEVWTDDESLSSLK
jgi:hypothetical protein